MVLNKHKVSAAFFFLFIASLVVYPCSLLAAKETFISPCTGYEKKDTLCRLKVTKLHPTQFSVGMLLVQCRKTKLEKKRLIELLKYLKKKKNHVPVVIGPYRKFYITDRHHLCCALLHATTDDWSGKEQQVVVRVMRNDNKSQLTSEKFWQKMVTEKNVYPYNNKGIIVDNFGLELSYMTLTELKDNPYRTLSKWVREGCGYIKKSEKRCVELKAISTPGSTASFLEMYWAMYLQTQLAHKDTLDSKQLEQLYPKALKAVLDKKKTGEYYQTLGLDPKEYGQNQTGKYIKLHFHQDGCVKKIKKPNLNQPVQ